MSEAWSRIEVETAVADYLGMLEMELRGEPYNKAEHNRLLQRHLDSRTKGSIERKHQNISAVLIELGYPYIDGYKPLGNYQELLRNVVAERVLGEKPLNLAVAADVEARVVKPPQIDDILSIQVSAPSADRGESRVYERPDASQPLQARNYLEIEARNQSLGRAGEELILKFEHERLWRAGKRALADKIEHVSQTEGDRLGYDILSFGTGGEERFIEVKTTRFGEMTPFFASRNEVNVSQNRGLDYHLYRLFSFRKAPKLFVLPGSLRTSCRLDAVSFSALPR